MASAFQKSAFQNNAFQIDEDDVAIPDPRTLSGVPSAIPRPRKRPDVRELAGVGYVSVLGAGSLTGDACLFSEFLIPAEASGRLVSDALRVLVGAIQAGGEALLAGVRNVAAVLHVQPFASAVIAREQLLVAEATVDYAMAARLTRDHTIDGRMPIRSGAEAKITAQESEEAIVLMASELLRRRLTD